MESPRELETKKESCFQLAAAAFSENHLDLDGYETLAEEIANAADIASLEVIEGSLPKPQYRSTETQLVAGDKSKIKKTGKWIDSERIIVRGNMSTITLDFTEYAGESDLRVEIELDCRMSEVRIVVPRNIDVIERLSSNSMSVFRDRRRHIPSNNAIVVSGDLSMSKVKVKRKNVWLLSERPARRARRLR